MEVWTKGAASMGVLECQCVTESFAIHHRNALFSVFLVWADNADFISLQYAGTGALKTDFTRTGKRSMWGLMADGWNSMIRYYKNNFTDGFRQDAIDLFLGM